MTGEGKSKYTRERLLKNDAPCLVFDVNNEYGQHSQHTLNLPTNTALPRSRYINGDINEFLSIAEKKRKTNIVFEEATGFFSGATGKQLRRMIINKRHTGNNYIFLFHSIRSVPPAILDWINYIVLFNTADDLPTIEKKHSGLVQPYLLRRNYPKGKPITFKWI